MRIFIFWQMKWNEMNGGWMGMGIQKTYTPAYMHTVLTIPDINEFGNEIFYFRFFFLF